MKLATDLPPPKEWAQAIAQSKRARSKVPEILSRLEKMAAELDNQTALLGAFPFDVLTNSIEGIASAVENSDRGQELVAIRSLLQQLRESFDSKQRELSAGITVLSQTIAAIPPPVASEVPEPVDITPIRGDIASLYDRLTDRMGDIGTTLEVPDMRLEVTERDKEGNISGVQITSIQG